MNEEEQKEKQITDAKAHQASKDVLSTSAKAAGTYFGGSVGGKAVDAISKTEAGDKILDSAANTVNSAIPEPLKKGMADNQKAISSTSKIADKAITAEPEALNTDNRGYNPYLEKPKAQDNSVSSPINPNSIIGEPSIPEENIPNNPNQDVEDNNSTNEDLNSLSEKHSKKNNIDDEGKGDIKLPRTALLLLPILGGVFLIVLFVIILFYNQINDEENTKYEYSNLDTCSRIIFNKDLEPLKDQLAEIDSKIAVATLNQNKEELENLQKEKYNLIPSISLDDYVAWIVDKEVGDLNNRYLYYDFAIAARTYLFNNSEIKDNFCYIDEAQNSKTDEISDSITDYVETTNQDIKDIVKSTHNYVLVEKERYIDTSFDSFCEDHTDDNFYYLTERNQAIEKSWVDENVDIKNTEDQCIASDGVTMSKYGAYYLVTVQHYGWKNILSYYYSGNVEIEKAIIIEMTSDGTMEYENIEGTLVGEATMTSGCSNLKGTPLKAFLAEHGSSIDHFNAELASAIETAGLGTREAVVTAGLGITSGLCKNFGIILPYQYTGGHGDGISTLANGDWGGLLATASFGYGKYWRYKSLDCSGFVTWALNNGGFNFPVRLSGDFRSVGPNHPMNSGFVGKIGDLIHQPGHIILIVGVDVENKRYVIAEFTGNGGQVRYLRFNETVDGPYTVIDMTSYYSNPANRK